MLSAKSTCKAFRQFYDQLHPAPVIGSQQVPIVIVDDSETDSETDED
jgi:hypothetical protein